MPRLVDGQGIPVSPGRHQYIIKVVSGTVTLSISSDDGSTYQAMTNGAFTADEDGIMIMSEVHVKADFSGTGTVDINYIGP